MEVFPSSTVKNSNTPLREVFSCSRSSMGKDLKIGPTQKKGMEVAN